MYDYTTLFDLSYTGGKSMEIKDNSNEVLQELNLKVAMTLKILGQKAEGYAKHRCPVDTGRLRNSISNAHDKDTMYVGTNVEYAPEVEFNDSARHKIGGAHFLRNSISEHKDEYEAIIKKILSN